MKFPDVAYIRWAKNAPACDVNLARSGVELCPPSVLGLRQSDLVTNLPVHDGYAPLLEVIATRYGTRRDQAYAVSGGTSFANWLACAALLNDAGDRPEVIVERPTYEPLLRMAEALGARLRRFDRRFENGYAVDIESFGAAVTSRTRLAIVSNLHNPSGARIPMASLRRMASVLARVGAFLLVDEVYLECLFNGHPDSSVHAGRNVVTTNSLTKAYGLDGLRAGWILGPTAVIRRAAAINDLFLNNDVAPGDRMALAAFGRIPALARRAHAILDPNLARVTRFLGRERRVQAQIPEGGNILFLKLPSGLDGDRLARHLQRRYSTLVVPGRFFESPGFIRISYGCRPARLARGLENLSRALDDLAR